MRSRIHLYSDKTSFNLIVPLADRLSLQSALGYADVGQTVSAYYETSLRFLPHLTLFYFEGGSQNQCNPPLFMSR
ncbi:MAG: hypothetical protein ACOVS5_09750 [Oligoflexus sp.]|jgi:hypothetical protein